MLKLSSKNFRSDERGSSTVESVIVMGVFVTILMWTLETGFLMFRWVNLERAVDEVSRDIRVFGLAEKFTDSSHPDYQPGAAHEFIKAEICDEAQSLDNCEDSLMLEMVSLDISSGPPTIPVACRDRNEDSFDPSTAPTVDPGDRGEPGATSVTYMRVCFVLDTLLAPEFSLPFKRDSSDGVAITVDRAFINEPANATTPGIGS